MVPVRLNVADAESAFPAVEVCACCGKSSEATRPLSARHKAQQGRLKGELKGAFFSALSQTLFPGSFGQAASHSADFGMTVLQVPLCKTHVAECDSIAGTHAAATFVGFCAGAITFLIVASMNDEWNAYPYVSALAAWIICRQIAVRRMKAPARTAMAERLGLHRDGGQIIVCDCAEEFAVALRTTG